MAVFTSPSEASRAAWTSAGGAPVTSCTSENARATSFAFVARTSTMRLPYVLWLRTIASVVSMLSTSFCAVPAFRRVDPAMNSGPRGRVGVARDGDRQGGAAPGLQDGRDDVGRPAGRADPDHHVVGRQAERVEVADGGCFVVLGALHRGGQGGVAAGDHADHLARVGTEGGRALAGVEDAEPARRAGADVDVDVDVDVDESAAAREAPKIESTLTLQPARRGAVERRSRGLSDPH